MVPDTTELATALESAVAQKLPMAAVARSKHILDFPAEILENIFRHVVMYPADDDKWEDFGQGERNLERLVAPFRLAAVCRTWRKIMLGYGALWSYICIPDPAHWEYGLQAPDLLGLMLKRSGVAPLWVLLPWHTTRQINWADDDISREILRRCIEALCAHSNRWAWLEFRAHMGPLGEEIIRKLLIQPTASLEKLHVSFGPRPPVQWQPNSIYRPLTRLLPHAPKLYRADLILEHWASTTRPMEKLVHLEVDVPRFPLRLCNLLALTPNLLLLSLGHNPGTLDARPEAHIDLGGLSGPVVLEHLERIFIEDSLSRKSLCLGVLARYVCLPNLRELDLPFGMTWLDESHMDDLTIFLKAHGSCLMTLTFREDRNLKWWRRMPKTQRKMVLELAHEQFWTLLSQPDSVSGELVAPALRTVRFEGLVFFPREGTAFREFHAKRCVPQGPDDPIRIEVLWFPQTGPERCHTYHICTSLFNLPWSEAEWDRLLDEGASKHHKDYRYFASSRYVTLGPEHAF